MTGQQGLGRTFHTASGATYTALGPSFAIAGGTRALQVSTELGDALLVELPEGLAVESLAARERALAREPHVLAAREVGVLVGSEARGAMPYRGSAFGAREGAYAVFPALAVRTLASALTRARAGARFPPRLVIALALECARGLAVTDADRPFTPSSIVVSTDGTARVRGPILEALVAHARASEASAPRWVGYRAPELLRATAPSTSAGRLFALGVMLLELLAGRALFPGNGAAAARAIARWRVSMMDIEGLGPDAPDALRALVWSLLHNDPDRRASPAMILDRLAPLYAPDPRSGALLAHEAALSWMFAL